METSQLICSANQWTGLYRIWTVVMKKLKCRESSADVLVFYLLKLVLVTGHTSIKSFDWYRKFFGWFLYSGNIKLKWVKVSFSFLFDISCISLSFCDDFISSERVNTCLELRHQVNSHGGF